MTAIGDKLKQAGYDTLAAEFYTRATEALKANKSVRDAWRALGESWGHVTLTRIWADMKGQAKDSELGGHTAHDTQVRVVPRQASGGQGAGDTQIIYAAARSTSPAKELKPFHDQRRPEAERKKVSAQATALALFWREMKMSKLRWEQLDGFIREKAMAGANKALASHFEIKQAALGMLIKKHAVPVDPKALCVESVKTDDAKRFSEISHKQATLIVNQIVDHNKAEIEDGIRLIAAE